MESLKGKLLIAIPDLGDPNFYRTVVLILQHDDQGATGVTLNRPSNASISKVWDEISDFECDCDRPVQIGGPVEGPLLALHTSLAMSEDQIIPGVFLTMSREHLNSLVLQTKHDFRIYSGYAGWAAGQLDAEIAVGGWLTKEADYDHVFGSDEEKLWRAVCEHVGHDIMLPHFNKKPNMIDPNLN